MAWRDVHRIAFPLFEDERLYSALLHKCVDDRCKTIASPAPHGVARAGMNSDDRSFGGKTEYRHAASRICLLSLGHSECRLDIFITAQAERLQESEPVRHLVIALRPAWD